MDIGSQTGMGKLPIITYYLKTIFNWFGEFVSLGLHSEGCGEGC